MRTALSKELAIIQGPPGTGKTFVGLQVAKVLLKNRAAWTHRLHPDPILVVCYTNHALDQFLEGILRFCPEGIVRVGSRSSSDYLKQFNLKELRKKNKLSSQDMSVRNSLKDCKRALQYRQSNLEKLSNNLEATSSCILKAKHLEKFMSTEHRLSLTSICMEGDDDRASTVVADWLTCALLPQGEAGEEEVLEGSIDPTTVHHLDRDVRLQLYR